MTPANRREFMSDVGRGMLAAGLGASLATDLGFSTAFADEPAEIPLRAEQRQDLYQCDYDDGEISFSAMSIGNPHMVIQVDDVDTVPNLLEDLVRNPTQPLCPASTAPSFSAS